MIDTVAIIGQCVRNILFVGLVPFGAQIETISTGNAARSLKADLNRCFSFEASMGQKLIELWGDQWPLYSVNQFDAPPGRDHPVSSAEGERLARHCLSINDNHLLLLRFLQPVPYPHQSERMSIRLDT